MTGGESTERDNQTKKMLPPATIFFRSKKQVEVCAVEGEDKKCYVLASGYSTFHVFHPDGSEVLVHMPSKGILKCHLSSLSQEETSDNAFLENSTRIQYCMYSPKGTYILTWERLNTATATDESKNLKIWNGKTGQYLFGFALKNLRREQWPPIQWTHDEAFAFHLVTNHLHVYKGQNVFIDENPRYERKIRCEGISSFSIPSKVAASTHAAPSTNDALIMGAEVQTSYLFTTFVPETKGKPGKLALLRYPDALGSSSGSKKPIASKSFYQAEECKAIWSPKGDAALVLTSTSVDSSGTSYYGSSNLYLITSSGECEPVPLPGNNNDGPVHDVAWMPDGNKASSFAMLSGRMPALGSLHNGISAQPQFLFGNAHRNTISWSPHGRFAVLAGFGNLAGGMDFWDRNKCKKIPQYISPTEKPTFGNTANCAVGYSWAPHSRYFMVSTTSPRMNVDNGVKLFKYNGLQLANLPFENDKYSPDQLLAAEFVPIPHTLYPDRPQTPPPRRPKGAEDVNSEQNVTQTEDKKSTDAQPVAFVRPPGRYVPPAARRAGSTSLAERMRREREGNTMGPTKVNNHKPGMSISNKKRIPIGASVAAAANTKPQKSKNALRRERQRLAKQKAEAEAAAEKAKQKETVEEPVDKEKIAKKLNKTLKQIEKLKEKDPTALNEDQKKKLASEGSIREQLDSLNLN